MPGFLTHLAARVFGARPAVRPRLPALFEAAPGLTAAQEPENSGLRVIDHEVAAPQPVVRTAPPPQADLRLEAAERPAAWTPEPRPTRITPAQRSTEAAEALETPVPAPRRSELRPPVSIEEPPHPPQRIVIHPELHAAPQIAETPQLAPRIAPLSTRREPESLRGLHEEEPRRPSVRAEPEPAAAAPLRSSREPAPPAPPPVVPIVALPSLRPAISAGQRDPLAKEEVPREAPSVQVTIGRLIVEAVMPAAAPPPMVAPRAPGPRLSLDDYLRQRRSQA